MPNNIIRHAEYGDLDLRKPDLGRPDVPWLWEILLEDKRPVEQRQLMCGEICLDMGRTEWMHVYERMGRRIAAHQSMEAERRHETAPESDEHKAYKDRTVRVAEAAGHQADAEVRSPDGAIRSDVLIVAADGERVSFEIQRSNITPQAVAKRDRMARAHGINAAWHTDQRDLSLRNEVPWTRTDNLSPAAIVDGRDLLIRSGIRNLNPYRCDNSAPTVCPAKGRGRCGGWHFTPDPLTIHYDEYVRGVAAGELVKVEFKISRRTNLFWVPTADRDRYENAIERNATVRAIPKPRRETSAVAGSATCRSRPQTAAEAARGPMPTAPIHVRPRARQCEAGVTPCGAPAQLYPCGWRCHDHRPGA